VLPFGDVIAVKRLNAMTGTHDEQFEAEAMEEKLLCYEYLPKGSLAKFLSGSLIKCKHKIQLCLFFLFE
jgi:hypothetical protein